MNWDALFDDLQSMLEAAERDELDVELGSLIEAEIATTTLVERVRAAVGRVVRICLADGDIREGEIVDCGQGWVLVARGVRQILAPLASVRWVATLGGAAPPVGLVASRLGLAYALRALARARVPVQVLVLGGQPLRGAIGRVGADHLDVVLDARGAPVVTIGFPAIVAVTTV